MSNFIDTNFCYPSGYQVDFDLLQEFDRNLNPLSPESCQVPCRVLGYGEISTVFEINAENMHGLAFKRMSIFENSEEMKDYLVTYMEYNRLLEDEIGIQIPPHGHAAFMGDDGRPIFYIIQEKVVPNSIGSTAIHLLPQEQTLELINCVLKEFKKVWDYNCAQGECVVGIDGQISNWVVSGFDSKQPSLSDNPCLLYVDTSTPFIRHLGDEQMDPELFLRAAPSFLVWILRLFFLQDVMDRYYDFHEVVVDLLANFYKEQKPELIPEMIVLSNDFFTRNVKDMDLEPITHKEVHSYYREDALIWSLYLSMRRLDRFFYKHVKRKEYPYILPGRIER